MKKIPVTLVIYTEIEVVDDYNDGLIQFHIEENHCNYNYIQKIIDTEEKDTCNLCSYSEAIVGHIPIEEIKKLKP